MDDLRLDPVGDQVMSCMSCWTRGGEGRVEIVERKDNC